MRGEHEHDFSETPATAGSPPLNGFDLGTDPTPGRTRQPLVTTSADHGFAALRDACAVDLGEAMRIGDAASIPPLAEAMADFALIDRGAIRPGSRSAQHAFRVGRLCLARRLIARHLSKSTLSPAMIAALLGVSVRHVHMLFETTGKSFSHTVIALRMAESRRLLRETPPRPIAEIAHACGFGSLATFYRVFNASMGLTPREFRAQRDTDPLPAIQPSRMARR
ncbi:helix-turn-helix transcriptional regulator [Bradyrhizobium jicamae]|uniref:helix-turn-helix transcriptional regulator n=1 Tax=Bradyrhizobium jicamae TaxID=280332 RepID=UPI00289EE215|nr:helix-turn-helix transcriptional regulator [Bradyrhizobium jicamae]